MDYPNTLLTNQNQSRKRYRVVGIAVFAIAVSLLVIRMVTSLISAEAYSKKLKDEILVDALFDLGFSVAIQIGILLVAVFLIYKFALRMSAREVLEFSNFRKTKGVNLALAVPIGFLALFITIGISGLWYNLIRLFGYTYVSSPDLYPERFTPGYFLLALFLTAVLPGFCEEFAMRGGFLTTMKKSYRGRVFYLLMAVAFGLFHQNITQVFYTMVFGGVMAFLAVRTKSIYPCMIVHFLNNGIGVYLDYAGQYGWVGGGIEDLIGTYFPLYLFVVVPMLTVVMIWLLTVIAKKNPTEESLAKRVAKERAAKEAERISRGYYGGNHPQGPIGGGQYGNQGYGYGYPSYLPPNPGAAVPAAATGQNSVGEALITVDITIDGEAKSEEKRYRPTLRDNAFYIGAIVSAAAFTVFSFVWGWMV